MRQISAATPFIWLLPFSLAFVFSIVATPIARLIALRTGIIDLPIGQKIHKRATPLMGGVAVFFATSLAALISVPLTSPVIGLIAGGAAAVTVGVIDERFSLPPLFHLGGQIVAASLGVVTGIGAVQYVSNPFATLTSPGWHLPLLIGAAFTIFWLVGMMNTVNFLDGLDGLATGVSAIAAILLVIWASEPGRFFLAGTKHHEDLLLAAALAGALCGFLPFNWHVAKIFLGDSGSMYLGFALGALSIIGPTKVGYALLIMLIPVLDVAWAIIRRQLHGRNFLSGDKQHVYHRMIELGMSHRSTVMTLYCLCVALGILDLEFSKVGKLLAFVVLASIVGGTFVYLEVRATRNARAAAEPGTGTKLTI